MITETIDIWAQKNSTAVRSAVDSVPPSRVLDINPRYFRSHDTIWQYSGICKTLKISRFVGDTRLLNGAARKPLIVVHGNVFYDFFYRSYADTPYYQKDFRQHTVQTSMNVTVKDKYSFRFNLAQRISNSPYFKNYFDWGLQFDQRTFLARMKQSAEEKIKANLLEKYDLRSIEDSIKNLQAKFNSVKSSLNWPDMTQLLIEERERNYYRELNAKKRELKTKADSIIDKGTDPITEKKQKIDSVIGKAEHYIAGKRQKIDSTVGKAQDFITGKKENIDSAVNTVREYVTERKEKLDSLQKSIGQLKQKADSLKNAYNKEINFVQQKLNKAINAREIKDVLDENDIPEEKKKNFDKAIADFKSFSIGRSMINYSELTVNNVSLTGINVEYNPRVYAAFAAGKIDYGFRDFTGRNKSANKQNLVIGRIGFGDKDRRAVIVSVFTGRKYNYGSVLNDTVNSYINVTGYSVEAILRKNENVGISAEVAKSTRPVTGRLVDNKESNSLFRFSDHSNQAISIKGETIVPETDTRISGFFRKSGENFQSFSLFTYNTDQTAWLLRADQSFLKHRVSLIAMLRRNDFTNPFTDKTFKTSTVFTSVQLNVRVPKWPAVSVGYNPGSQLYIVDRATIRENVYYIMNASMIHTYSLFGINMMSSAIYNHYSNKGTDSGFVNYSGKNYMLSHSLLFRKLQLNGSYTESDQQELKFFTLEANADFFPVPRFKIGAGGKYNRTEFGETYWGGRALLMLEIKKLGGLQLQYEKSFLPTIHQTLFPVEVGRVTWFKYF
ncbi:MAG: hypothetical protein ACHQFX_06950 [Chitinophagales bacterium]